MRVALDDREVATRLSARRQTGRGAKELVKEDAALGREIVAQPIGEPLHRLLQARHVSVHFRGIGPGADCRSQTRIVPPHGVELRPRRDDGAALRGGRRKRPGGRA